MSNIEEVVQIFQNLLKAQSTQEVQHAQKQINIFLSDPNLIETIKNILLSNNISNIIKKSIAVFTIKYTRHTLIKKDQSKINMLCQQLLRIIQYQLIPIQYRMHIKNALEIMLANDKAKIIKNAFMPNLVNLLKSIKNISDQNINYNFLALFGQILMASPGFSSQVMKFIQDTFLQYVQLTINIQIKVQQALIKGDQIILYKSLQTLNLYSYLIKLYLRRFIMVDAGIIKLLYADNLQPMISKAFNLNIISNPIKSSVYILTDNQHLRLLNKIKSNFIGILTAIIKNLKNNVKQTAMLNLNATFSQTLNYLPIFINQTALFLGTYPYYKIKDRTPLKTVQEVLKLLIVVTRCNYYYSILHQNRTTVIQGIIFNILTFTPQQFNLYNQDPQQFLNQLIHIIQRDSGASVKPPKEGNQTLKTMAAQVLLSICKYQDGTLAQLFKFCSMVIQGQLNVLFQKSMIMLTMAIVRDLTRQRGDIVTKLSLLISNIFQKYQLPTKNQQKTLVLQNLQYSIAMLIVTRYINYFIYVDQKIIGNIFNLIFVILGKNNIQEVPKLICYQLIQMINKLSFNDDQIQNKSSKILNSLNSLLITHQKPSIRLLDCLFSLFKYNDNQLKKNTQLVIQSITTLSIIVKKQMNQNNKDKLIINKCWNIIRQIGQSQQFIPTLINDLEKCILPFLPYLDTQIQDIDFQEDILLLMTSFIQKSKSVTINQLKIFQFIPKIFFQRYQLTFGHCFITLQTFIFYGKQILANAPMAIKSIVQMARASILTTKIGQKVLTEADNCQGVLILQSLILSCGSVFDQTVWKEIVNIVTQRLEMHPTFNLLKSNLIATLALSLLGGFKKFEADINELLLTKILQSISCFTVAYSPKVLIVALCQLLCIGVDFVKKNYSYIIDVIVTILQLSSNKQPLLFDQDAQEDQDKDYKNSLVMLINSVKNIDQFQYFKNKINWIKQNQLQILQSAVNQLPQSKKDFLKNMLSIQRIMNQPRQIFRVKR